MPIYEYTCKECDAPFEYLVMGGKEPDACPACKSDNISRMMSRCAMKTTVTVGGVPTPAPSSGSSCSGCSASSCAGCG